MYRASRSSKNRKLKLSEFRIRWIVFIPLLLLHIGAILSPFFFDWGAVILAAFLSWATGMFGITVCYHRMLTHKSFETFKIIRWFHLFCASLTLQQGPLSWVRIHRAHHAHSDTDFDPTSSAFRILVWTCGVDVSFSQKNRPFLMP